MRATPKPVRPKNIPSLEVLLSDSHRQILIIGPEEGLNVCFIFNLTQLLGRPVNDLSVHIT